MIFSFNIDECQIKLDVKKKNPSVYCRPSMAGFYTGMMICDDYERHNELLVRSTCFITQVIVSECTGYHG